MRMYLDDEMVREDETFKAVQFTKKDGGTFYEYSISNTRINIHNGRFYIEIGDDGYIPNQFKEMAEAFSFRNTHIVGVREGGIYEDSDKFSDTTAEVVVPTSYPGATTYYILEVTGTSVSDVLKLVRVIRDGSIRPAISDHQIQGGRSITQATEELNILDDRNRKLQARLDEAELMLSKISDKSELMSSKIVKDVDEFFEKK